MAEYRSPRRDPVRVMPDDPRLAPFAAQCHRLTGAALRRDFSCIVADETGRSVSSTCSHAFAKRAPDGRAYPVSLREAIELTFSGSAPFITEIETDAGRVERRERLEALQRSEKLAALRPNIANLLRSRSPVVRDEASKLLSQISQQRSQRSGPTASAVDDLFQHAQALIRLCKTKRSALRPLIGLRSSRKRLRIARPRMLPAAFGDAWRLCGPNSRLSARHQT